MHRLLASLLTTCLVLAATFAPTGASAQPRTLDPRSFKRITPKRHTVEESPAPDRGLRLEDVAFYTYTLRGRGLDEVKEEAKGRAMASTIGEFYFDDRFVLAPEILNVYLEPRQDEFIAGLKILEVRQGVGVIEVDVQVAINRRKLETDLAEKRFFYEPRRKPYFHVSLAERLDGQTPSAEDGRQQIIRTLTNLAGRPSPYPITVPASSLDVDANQDLLYQALVACRRQGIELLITGTAEARQEGQRRLYFTNYYFYMTDITLKLINVQDGQTLRSVTLTGKGSDPDQATAARLAIERAARDATQIVLDGFFDEWRDATQDRADYRILVRDIAESDLTSLIERLEKLKLGTEVLTKSYINRVAVLNLYYDGDRERLRKFLNDNPYPKFNLDLFDERRIKISILQ